jgi:hypothetical protein
MTVRLEIFTSFQANACVALDAPTFDHQEEK